jgi:hypothetical protein
MPRSPHHIDWAIVILSALFLTGLFIDGWAHTHDQVDESFFTPWHAIFYSAFALVAIFLVGVTLRNKKTGLSWTESIPIGYGWSMIGVMIFAGGGLFDLVWHELFGVEENVEALLSPSHLILAVGMWLIVSGPFRAAWLENNQQTGYLEQVPRLLSLSFSMSVLTFITQIAHPLTNLWALGSTPENQHLIEELGVMGWMLTTATLMGVLLFAAKHWRLAPGAITTIIAPHSIAMGFLHGDGPYPVIFVATSILAAIMADIVLAKLQPLNIATWRFRLFSFLTPVLLSTTYFITALATDGIWWSVHFWTGTIAISGIIGLLMSYLLVTVSQDRR